MARNIEALLETRIREWSHPADRERLRRRLPLRPSVAVSHSMGSRGEEIAAGVAEALGFRLYDREIIDLVAESTKVQRRLVEELDEQLQSTIDQYVTSVLRAQYLDPDHHFREMARAISAIATHGGAVIVGRGAGLYLDRSRTVAVRIDASFDTRWGRHGRREQLQPDEARARVARSDANRGAYFRKHFHVAWQDAQLYDLVINTDRVDVPSAIQAVVALTNGRFPGSQVVLPDGDERVDRQRSI